MYYRLVVMGNNCNILIFHKHISSIDYVVTGASMTLVFATSKGVVTAAANPPENNLMTGYHLNCK